ncbi:alcohol dehydrogenase catalytic domain-containing protein [Cobetia amphilecti]|uniref:alcohol dehydrogenase catalytic domain-containing protein n=1 Tax=Cobetia TaxID=204286 RepID=UPI002942E822|nr:alcohol dehydrogenase catalytic domain-containing protein [Cobetia amphilecti]WOI25015.1 alcohol dehydrogenase catalytic domain-containing protein [Cobetia amphilecti]
MKIRAAVTATQGQPFDLKDVELASPKGDEILVRVVATGVCHTDAAARDLGIAPYPIVLGHEGAGVVEQIGDNVRDMEVGDHVVLSFAHCGHCSHCLTGHPTVCERGGELNFGGVMDDGGKRLSCDGHDVATFFGQSSFATHAVVSERKPSRSTAMSISPCWVRWVAASRLAPAPSSIASSRASVTVSSCSAVAPWA